jgi:hypothetical protein
MEWQPTLDELADEPERNNDKERTGMRKIMHYHEFIAGENS